MQAKLKRLSPAGLRRLIKISRGLHCFEDLTLLPIPLRIALLHAGITAIYLYISPPIESIPPIFIPIVWAASFATTLQIWSLGRFLIKKLELLY